MKRIIRQIRAYLLTLIGLTLLLGATPGKTQTIGLGTASATLTAVETRDGSWAERAWAATFNSGINPKTNALMGYANSEMGANYRAIPSEGFRVYAQITYTQNGVSAAVNYDVTVIPLKGTSSRYAGGSAALVCYQASKIPGLAYPRLLLRKGAAWGSAAVELSAGLDGHVYETSGKRGNSLIRSASPLLKNTGLGAAEASLKNAWDASVYPIGATVTDSLRSIMDTRLRSVGQNSFNLASSLLFSTNLSIEYPTGVIDAAISSAPAFSDQSISVYIRQQLANMLKQALQDIGRKIGEYILSLLPF